MTSPAEFHDLTELSLNQGGKSWGNLDHWQDEDDDNSNACRTLAMRFGEAAPLDKNP